MTADPSCETESKTSVDNKPNKWTEEILIQYEDDMYQTMLKMLGEHAYNSEEVEQFVDEIVDIAQKKLKSGYVHRRVKRMYSYFTTVLILPKASEHSKRSGFTWDKNTDYCVTVQLQTSKLRCILCSYMIKRYS